MGFVSTILFTRAQHVRNLCASVIKGCIKEVEKPVFNLLVAFMVRFSDQTSPTFQSNHSGSKTPFEFFFQCIIITIDSSGSSIYKYLFANEPINCLFRPLPSGRRFRAIKTKISWFWAVPEIILGGSGPQAAVLWGEGVFLTCPRGGEGQLVLGVKAYLIHSGAGLIRALMCPWGRGALTPCVSWGWRDLKKHAAHPPTGLW